MPTSFYNTQQLKQYRRSLRKASTPAELVLWNYIRNSKLDGKKFRRQYSLGNYILDFYCPQEKLAIELDGAVHTFDSAHQKDKIRDEFLRSQNIKVLRFENKYIFEQLELVLKSIRNHFKS